MRRGAARDGDWLRDRSSRPHRQPRRLTPSSRRGSARFDRRQVGGRDWSPARPVSRMRRSGGCSGAHGMSRRPRAERGDPTATSGPAPAICCTWTSARYARFRRPGHRATGDRSQRDRHWMQPETRVGYDYAHAIVDDHTRLAYVELHDDERAATVTAFVERALVVLRRPRHHRAAADDRQRLHLHQEPLAARAARRPRHPPSHHPALPAAHQRQGRTLPPDHGPRMGPRPQLPHQRAPSQPPERLARPLQPPATASALGNRPPISRVHNL